MFEWNSFAFISLICFLMSAVSAALMLSAKRSGESLLWGFICILLSMWTFGLFFCFSADTPESALFWARIANYIAIFIPVSLFHFCTYFAGKADYYRRITTLYYLLCVGYFLLTFFYPDHFLHSPSFRLSEFWFPYAGSLFYIFPIIYICLIGHSIQLLIASKVNSSRTHQRKVHYLIINVLIGLMGAGSSLLLEYGIDFPPYGVLSIAFVVLMITYTILKHDLLALSETVSLITARVLIYIIIFAVIVGVIKFGAFLDNVHFSSFQITVIYILMVMICELYALMKSRVQSLSDRMLTRRKMTNDSHFKLLMNQLESASDLEAMLPLLREFFEKQFFIYHYAWYLDQSLLAQSLKKESLKGYERNQNPNDSAYQRILFSSGDGRRHDRLPASLRLNEASSKKASVGFSKIEALLNSEQMDQAYQWVDSVPGRELIALPLMTNSLFRGLIILVVNRGGVEYSDQLMFETLIAKLASVVERFDAIRKVSRVQQTFLLEKMHSLQLLAGDMANEMQLPLSQMDSFISEVYSLSRSMQSQDVDVSAIANSLRADTNKARLAVQRSVQLIDLILRQVQNPDVNYVNFAIYSIQNIVSKALAEYVFLEDERCYVTTDLSQDFSYKGDEQLLVFVIFNLLKSALSQIEYPAKFEIHISTSDNENLNWLSIRFNHLPKYRADVRFSPDSQSEHIDHKDKQYSNLSLAYCHRVMTSFSGEMHCLSHGEEMTEFKLGFPRIV